MGGRSLDHFCGEERAGRHLGSGRAIPLIFKGKLSQKNSVRDMLDHYKAGSIETQPATSRRLPAFVRDDYFLLRLGG